MDIFLIESTQTSSVALDTYDALGIAYPVHAFNAPKIVMDFVKRLPEANAMPAFIISTAGAHHFLNFASSKLLIKKLTQKGFDVFYDRQFTMPSNFIVQYDDRKVKQIISETDEQIDESVRELARQVRLSRKSGFFADIAAFLGRAEWFGAKLTGKFLYADKNCTRCGLCATNCPNRNISVDEMGVRFKCHCGLCMRCIHLCPKSAINVRRPFRFIVPDALAQKTSDSFRQPKHPVCK